MLLKTIFIISCICMTVYGDLLNDRTFNLYDTLNERPYGSDESNRPYGSDGGKNSNCKNNLYACGHMYSQCNYDKKTASLKANETEANLVICLNKYQKVLDCFALFEGHPGSVRKYAALKYLVVTGRQMTPTDAVAECRSYGGTLAELTLENFSLLLTDLRVASLTATQSYKLAAFVSFCKVFTLTSATTAAALPNIGDPCPSFTGNIDGYICSLPTACADFIPHSVQVI